MNLETLPENHDTVTHCALLQLGWEPFAGGLYYRSPYPEGEMIHKRVFYSWRAAIAIETRRHQRQDSEAESAKKVREKAGSEGEPKPELVIVNKKPVDPEYSGGKIS